MAAAKAWLAERRALLVLDDIWEDDVKDLAPGPASLVALHVAPRSLPWISPAYSLEVKGFSRGEAESIFRIYLADETLMESELALRFCLHMQRRRQGNRNPKRDPPWALGPSCSFGPASTTFVHLYTLYMYCT
jgi:hypothetical protein